MIFSTNVLNTESVPIPIFNESYWGDGLVVSGNAIDTTYPVDTFLSVIWQQEAPALNDEIKFPMALTPGEYDFSITGERGTDKGIMECRVQGVEFFEIDWYGVQGTNLQFNTTLTIPEGFDNLSFLINGANVSSLSPFYYASITMFTLRMTS